MFLTAATINEIYNLCQKERIYEEILKRFFPKKNDLNEFRQHLWLQISEQPRDKIIYAWNNHYFKYLYTRILTNQVNSSTSSWIKQTQPNKHYDLIEDYQPFFNIYQEVEDLAEVRLLEIETKKDLTIQALNHYLRVDPQFFVEKKMFEEYYFNNKSFRQIEAESTLINGKKINYVAIRKCVEYAELLVKTYIKKQNKKTNI